MKARTGAAPALAALTLILQAVMSPAVAQEAYPARAITLSIPFSAGSQPDILGRGIAEGIGKLLGQPIVVLNKEGAAGTISVEFVANARPDGYTLGYGPQGQFSIQPHLRKDLNYKPDGFDFLCQTNSGVFAIVSGPNSPYKNFAELIEAARKAPGKLNFASAGHATAPHLIGESIALEAGVKLTHVPFRSVGDMYAQTINGTVDFVATTPVALAGGRGMKPLAVVGSARLTQYPDVPLLTELGYKRSTLAGQLGLYAPKGIPSQAAAALRKACAQAHDTPAFRAASDKTATPMHYADAPAYAAAIAEDYRLMGELLGTLGVKAQ